jgi:hypothetical protein
MLHLTPEAATHSALLGQRENPFPNFEDSREGGMELSLEDHLAAKRIPKPRFFWGGANGTLRHWPNGLWNLLCRIFGSLPSRDLISGVKTKNKHAGNP